MKKPFCLPGPVTFLMLALLGTSRAFAVKVERDVPIPLRDGVKLQADIFRPDDQEQHPVLVLRTGNDRKARGEEATGYAEAGFIAVTVDVRGRHGSGGEFDSSWATPDRDHEAADGYDTIEWAARLPGSTGKVGTWGLSEAATVQWKAAFLRPPHLVAMAAGTGRAVWTRLDELGTWRPLLMIQSIYQNSSVDSRRRAGVAGPNTRKEAVAQWQLNAESILWFLPRADMPDSLWGSAEQAKITRDWLRDPAGKNPWDFVRQAPQATVPNIYFVGWFDHGNTAIDLRTAIVARGGSEVARKNQRLIIGPWIHVGYRNRKIGDLDFGPEAAYDIVPPQIRWFNHWLKGADNGEESDAPVRIFVMGINRWRDEKEWPPSDAVRREFYLGSGKGANTPAGDGHLAAERPAAGADRYQYDPRDPVPSLIGLDAHAYPRDQALLKYRRDILVYQTEVLAEPMEVTGYPELELYAASSTPDTDFMVKLIDVYPDGRAICIDDGRVRARFRDGLEPPKFLTPGETTRYLIRLGPTSIQFQKGHRIRIDVTSSDFPNFERNHNTAADHNQNDDAVLVTADQTIFQGGAQASRLILPEIRRAQP